jgi:hypothetical protein
MSSYMPSWTSHGAVAALAAWPVATAPDSNSAGGLGDDLAS